LRNLQSFRRRRTHSIFALSPSGIDRFACFLEHRTAFGNQLGATSHGSALLDVIKIVRAAFASVQDAGRAGFAHLGVSRAGFADARSAALANLVLGNALGAPAVEVFAGAFSVEFLADVEFATAGLVGTLTLDGTRIPAGGRQHARAGQRLTLSTIDHGRVLYLALAGAIEVPQVLGSAATDISGGFGGHEGRTLRPGDVLRVGQLPRLASHGTRAFFRPALPDYAPLRVIFSARCPANLALQFTAQSWRVSVHSQRAGTRLDGPTLTAPTHDGISAGVVPGVIQLPPNGAPIVLGADAQTVGGYAVVGTVIHADMWRIAQAAPGDVLHFATGNLAQARRALELQRIERARVALALGQRVSHGAPNQAI
jgi:5-oxoprolinase (ATP-hydrolysing) subunit C